VSATTVFIVLFAAIVLAGALYFGAKRKKELATWAESRGLSFSPGADRSFDDRYPEFGCLRRGHSRYAYNIMTGTRNERPLEAFDYRYVTGSGKNRTTHTFSAVIVESRLPLKPLRIRSENALDKITEFFGVDDIDFESDRFSREFHVKSPDKKWAYDVIHQRTMEFLINSPRFSIEMDERCVICWRNRRFGVQHFEDALAVAEGLLDRLPEYLIREQRRKDT
jgi:hypothetical protein